MVVTEEHNIHYNTLLVIFMLYQSRVIHHAPTAAVSTKQNAMTISSSPSVLSVLPGENGENAGSFREQRLVIEPTLRTDKWSCLF